MKRYCTYFMSSLGGTLYTGVTKNIFSRVLSHKPRINPGFTQRYNVTRLVYYEKSRDVNTAIAREKEITGWRRSKKITLIQSLNPKWRDLAADWFSPQDLAGTE